MAGNKKAIQNSYCNSACKDCKSFRTGILTSREIKSFKLIDPINENVNYIEKKTGERNSLHITTYDLRLGELHYVSSRAGWIPTYIGEKDDSIWAVIKNEQDFYADNNKLIVAGNTLKIPAYGKALIQLLETVDTASIINEGEGFFIVGHFDLKLSKVQKGLISQQATQVEPFYKGKLFCYLFNFSGKDVELTYKERIASIEFSYVTCETKCKKSDFDDIRKTYFQANNDKYERKIGCSATGITDARFFAYNKCDQGRGLPSGFGLEELRVKFEDKINEANQVITKAKEAAEEAKKAAEAVKDKKKQNKDSRRYWLTIIIAAFALAASIFMALALKYNWFDSLIKKSNKPPVEEQPIIKDQVNINNENGIYSLIKLRDKICIWILM